MSDIKLPRLPNVQVPRIDADVSLIDVRVLAKWCQRIAAEYARTAVEADRAEHAQKDAETDEPTAVNQSLTTAQQAQPTLMEVRHLWDAATEATGGDGLEAMQHFARLVLAQDAEQAKDAVRAMWAIVDAAGGIVVVFPETLMNLAPRARLIRELNAEGNIVFRAQRAEKDAS